MRPWRLGFASVLLCTACALRPADRDRIDLWLECDECNNGELESLLEMRRLKRGALIDRLAVDLLRGASSQSIASLRRQYREDFAELSAYPRSQDQEPLTESRDEYVDHYLDNFRAVYRSRAAIALGRLGGPRVRQLLDSALRDSLRDDLRDIVTEARARMGK